VRGNSERETVRGVETESAYLSIYLSIRQFVLFSTETVIDR
jgi:hypothetical protein